MATATQATVVLTRTQRDVCCRLLEEELNFHKPAALIIAGGRFFEAMRWDDPNSDAERFELVVDDYILDLGREVFADVADDELRSFLKRDRDEYCRDHESSFPDEPAALAAMFYDRQFEQYGAIVSATDAILAVA